MQRARTTNPFAGMGAEYDAWYDEPLGAFVERAELGLLLEVLSPRPGEVVVDVGAGTGRLARRLAEDCSAGVIAVEPSRTMREVGERRTSGLDVTWHDAGAESLPLEDASADAVVFVTVLEFLPDPVAAVGEARRVLRPGGRLVVASLSALSGWGALYRSLADSGQEPWRSARFWTPESLVGLLGIAPSGVRGTLYLSPGARPPYEEADDAGRRAGNAPAFLVAGWEKDRW